MKWVALLPFTISFRVVLPFFAIGLGASIGRCRGCPPALRHAAKDDPGSDLAFRMGCDDGCRRRLGAPAPRPGKGQPVTLSVVRKE
jgi:hypothetical protein